MVEKDGWSVVKGNGIETCNFGIAPMTSSSSCIKGIGHKSQDSNTGNNGKI